MSSAGDQHQALYEHSRDATQRAAAARVRQGEDARLGEDLVAAAVTVLDLAVAGQCIDLESVRVTGDHVERADADRAGGDDPGTISQHLPCARSAGMSTAIGQTIVLLLISNVFMTFAWYAHLRHLADRPWLVAALVSWGIALFEYLIQVPANRIGFSVLDLGRLKILQEVITLAVFVPFAVFYMRQPLRLDFLWAALCLLGAVYFMFRQRPG